MPAAPDELPPVERRARLVRAFAERLDPAPLCARIKSVPGHPGHPPADPRGSRWRSGPMPPPSGGVGSARALAGPREERIGSRRLAGGVGLDRHDTPADFRAAHGAVPARLPIDGPTARPRSDWRAWTRRSG